MDRNIKKQIARQTPENDVSSILNYLEYSPFRILRFKLTTAYEKLYKQMATDLYTCGAGYKDLEWQPKKKI